MLTPQVTHCLETLQGEQPQTTVRFKRCLSNLHEEKDDQVLGLHAAAPVHMSLHPLRV